MQFHIPYYSYLAQCSSKRLALYQAIRDCITSQVLVMETKLPSSRELAALYGLSRGTVSEVYAMLASEGYITSGVGRGTFVSFQSPKQKGNEFPRQELHLLSDWGVRLKELEEQQTEPSEKIKVQIGSGQRAVNFQEFGPGIQAFPDKEWNRCLYAQARLLTNGERRSRMGSTLGDEALRDSIAQYLRRARGIAAKASQIVIFNGSKQALALAAHLFINPGDHVVVESPGYRGVIDVFRAQGGRCIHAPIDGQGIIPDKWKAKLLFVTPNRQFPTGAVLNMERRQQLLAWASENNALILEDDYDSVFRHRGKSLEPLKVLDSEGRVIYIGSFSNTLLPHIRIGYAVLPSSLVEVFASAKAAFEPSPSNLLEQRTLASWMNNGQYERHLRRMKRIYGRKFKLLRELLTAKLSSWFQWVEGDAGLSIFGWWKGTADQYVQFRSNCLAAGIMWSETCIEEQADGNGIRYGAYFYFPRLSEEEIVYGVNRMQAIGLDLIQASVK
ncbi:PLP-dependent aminotransferase family protein [Paenibacillus sp. S-12]|uniref:MocR-like pyridoxine biosynthesis transcription factor PdxR n=1 Tax=Paenibacillus sp. S-12 TaxID=3031371 RepID=UPI0025A0096C|nr:PLP-dependent aminotransferase family protein [Paenibacillus sp. S-12]